MSRKKRTTLDCIFAGPTGFPAKTSVWARRITAAAAISFSVFVLVLWAGKRTTRAEQRKALGAAARRIQTRRLQNGLTVIAVEDMSVPLVTIEIAVKSGSFTEPPTLNGLSHLYEHMFFKGNKEIPNQEAYLKKVRRLGMVFNGETREESVAYYFSLHRDRLADGLLFMKNALLYPLFDPQELKREKQIILAEYDRAEADPAFHLQRAVGKRLWYKYWSRKNPLGQRPVIRKASRAQMQLIKNRYYQPGNAALIVGGAVKASTIFKLAQKVFGSWKGKKVTLPQKTHPPLKRDVVTVVHRPVKSATVMLAWQGPAAAKDPAATYAADVFCFAINERTSAFQKALVRTGLVNRTSLFYLTRRAKGPIYLALTTSADKVIAALQKAQARIRKWDAAEVLSDAQIRNAKVRLRVEDIYAREKTSSFCHLLGRWWAAAGLPYYLSYVSKLQAVTRADMQRFVRTYIQGKPKVVGVLVSKQDGAQAGLSKAALEKALATVGGNQTPKSKNPKTEEGAGDES